MTYTSHKPTPTPDPQPPRSPAAKPIMVLIAVLGGLILLVVAVTTGFSSAVNFTRGTSTMTADTTGITDLDVDASASQFNLEFADVNEATLQTDGVNAEKWRLDRNDDQLVVQAPNRWLGWCFINCAPDEQQVTLQLPAELNDGSLNVDLELAAGRLVADGDFEHLGVEVGAGEANINGSADQLEAQLNAGSANLNLGDVQTADLEVSAGRLITDLTGDAPENINAEVSAGRLELTVPETEYAVNSDVAAGNLDNQLQTHPTSNHQIDIELSAGNAVLESQDATNQ